mgnify:CR=1 FL=1
MRKFGIGQPVRRVEDVHWWYAVLRESVRTEVGECLAGRPQARIYEMGTDDLSVVMIVDEGFDI